MSARRTDPERRDNIVAATRALIAQEGVDGVSHRKVAALADVPLGSMTYHFAGRDELIFEVFSNFSHQVADLFETTMQKATGTEQAIDLIVDLVNGSILADQAELVLTHELYALAARDARYREITHTWMTRSRTAFERHFSPQEARLLDAIVEGWSIHRALDTTPGPKLTSTELRRVLGR